MRADKKFFKAINKRFAKKQNELRRQPGVMGDGNSVLAVPNADNFIYVTIGNKAVPVFNNRVDPQVGVKVWVGYAPEEPTLFQVLSTRSETPAGVETGFVGYAPAKRYEWNAVGGGQDPLHVHLRAFSPLKLGMSATGGMNVDLYRGYIYSGTEYLSIARQDVDLTAQIPSTTGKAALVLITIDNTGTVIQTKGSEVDIDVLALTDLPATPANTVFVCGAVRVYYGQTVVQEGRTNTDFVDLRFPGQGGGGGGLPDAPSDSVYYGRRNATWTNLKTYFDTLYQAIGSYIASTRTISTTAPLAGGGDLSADRTLSITAATTLAAGSMSAADKTKLDAISGSNTGDQTITLTGDVTGSGTGSFAATIAAAAVTLAKMANMATASVFYRKTAGSGAPEVQTLATLKTDLGLTGTNSGDQTITLTGDVTGSGTGSFAATIAAAAVTLAKMANMATASVFYRKTAGSGAPEVQTLATLKTDLGLTGTNSGDQTITLTGDVTGSGTGSFAATIAAAAVTLAKMANMATASVFYRKTAGTGAPEVQTLATLKTDLGLTGTNSGDQTLGSLGAEATANKDASGGYAGLTLFKINFKNVLNTFTSFFTNSNTAARTYTFKDADGTVAFTSDITGTNSGTNTGDETGARLATLHHAASAKSVLVDADEIVGGDSAASFGLIRSTWTNVKAFLKTYNDGIYAALAGLSTQVFSAANAAALENVVRADQIQSQSVTAYTTGGTSTAYTLTTFATALALTTNERWTVKFNATAGSSPTLNRDGKGAKSLKYYANTGTKINCGANVIVSNMISDVIYDGTDYILLNPCVVDIYALRQGSSAISFEVGGYATINSALPAWQQQSQAVIAFTTGGTSTAFTLTTIGTPIGITTNERWCVKFNATAGASPTLNRDGKGAKSLKYYDATGAKIACSATTIIANIVSDVFYDGTDYVVLDPVITDIPNDGWIPTSWASPTRTSDTVFTVAVDVTGIIYKGMKLKVTDTSTKYFVVVSVTFGAGVSTITTIASTDHKFVGNPSNIFYSNVEQPFGFPARFNFTSTVTYSGGTTDPTSTTINTAYWRVINGDFFVTIKATLVRGTGNRTFTSFSIPITPLAISMFTGADDITVANLSSATSCYAYTDALIYYQRTMANNGNYYINGFVGF